MTLLPFAGAVEPLLSRAIWTFTRGALNRREVFATHTRRLLFSYFGCRPHTLVSSDCESGQRPCTKTRNSLHVNNAWLPPYTVPTGSLKKSSTSEMLMKIGIIGTGNVGCACAMTAAVRGSAREIVLVNRTRRTAEAVATDIRYGIPLGPKVDITDGDYGDLEGAEVVLITSGVNEKTGGATDRNDPQGRLRLLEKNARIYRDIVPKIVSAAPGAVLLVVTDPPDPLADVARETSAKAIVLSAGTYLDSQRFRVHLGKHFGVDPAHVEAQVIGDHGTAQVFLWSSARVGGVPIAALLKERGDVLAVLRENVE